MSNDVKQAKAFTKLNICAIIILMNGKVYFAFLGLVVFIVTVFVIAATLINGGNDTTVADESKVSIEQFADTDTSEAVFYRRGRIRADESHTSYRITINQVSRTLEVLEGFEGVVVERQVFPNNPESYEEFIFAISGRGLEGIAEGEDADPRGVCPDNLLSEYTITNNSDTVAYQWVGDCGIGTTNTRGVSSLFKSQIPDFFDTLSDFSL